MIQNVDKNKCCGCTACYNACPKSAISMVPDEEGFEYPTVNNEKCVDCGRCEKVCPVLQKLPPDCDKPLKAYVVRNKDTEILNSSASGGFFSALAEHVVSLNGYVYGVAYDEQMQVRHIGTNSKDQLEAFRSSKYVQSKLGDSFRSIKSLLDNNVFVCFSGTPCQVEGLLRYMGRKYSNLVTVDIICHGVPSPMLWKQYLSAQVSKYKSSIIGINFRNKDYGYHNSTLKLVFENGKTHHGSIRNDAMMRCFFGEISSRPSCYGCAFKYAKHESDFTIYDAWHGAQLAGRDDDNRGYTHLFVQSKKGEELLPLLADGLEMSEVDAEKAIELDGPMVRNSAVPHKYRSIFLKDAAQNGIELAVEKYIPIFPKDVLLVSAKGFLHKIGLLDIMKKLPKKIDI